MHLFISNNGHLERVLSPNEPMAQSTKHDSTKDWASVVHVILVDWQDLWEWHPEDHIDQVAERSNVDRNANYTHLEGSVWWGRSTELSK